jgi:DNA-directed RNA polymerase specialized sigma24 family protein
MLSAEESRRRLWHVAAQTLSEQQTTALWLYYVEDMPVKRIAWILGFSRVAVKTMMFRARKKLMPVLEELPDDHCAAPSQIAATVRKTASHAPTMEVPYVL